MNADSKHISIILLMTALLLPSLSRAQDASLNYVSTVTMLDSSGTDSLQAVQYYNGLGWPTVSVSSTGASGGTVCVLTTWVCCASCSRPHLK